MEKKITKRTVLEALIAAANEGNVHMMTEDVTVTDVIAYAENEIALLDKRAERAKVRAEKAKAEADELTEVVYAAMTDEFETIADIATRIEGADVTVGKVGARLRKLVDLGRAEKGELKIKGEDGSKTRVLVAYKRA